jgi:hypothetical protein
MKGYVNITMEIAQYVSAEFSWDTGKPNAGWDGEKKEQKISRFCVFVTSVIVYDDLSVLNL